MTGLNIVHVPFQGTGAAIPAVISNQVGAMWGFIAGLVPTSAAGRSRRSRSAAGALGGLARRADGGGSGVPGYEATSWIGLLAPAGTPQPLIDKLWEAISTAMQEPAVKDVLLRDGSDIITSKPAEFRQIIEHDYAKYGKLADLFRTAK